jgi:hypothetical protein
MDGGEKTRHSRSRVGVRAGVGVWIVQLTTLTQSGDNEPKLLHSTESDRRRLRSGATHTPAQDDRPAFP